MLMSREFRTLGKISATLFITNGADVDNDGCCLHIDT